MMIAVVYAVFIPSYIFVACLFLLVYRSHLLYNYARR